MKVIITIVLVIHALIHSIGFIKANFPNRIPQLKNPVSKLTGMVWLLAGLTFLAGGIMLLIHAAWWWVVVIIAASVSQILIIRQWSDSRFGTIINLLLLSVCVSEIASWKFENKFQAETAALNITSTPQLLTESDISGLPIPVQKYIRVSGAIGKPQVKNFKIEFTGQIRQDSTSGWILFTSEQINSIEPPARLFFMKATMKNLPVAGYHVYQNSTATMDIRLLSLFRVQYQSGSKMDMSETVTWFNDLCLFAPAALIDKRIHWQPIDSLSTKATFSDKNFTISAQLFFNSEGYLVNFISPDRYRIVSDADQNLRPFSTPINDYITIRGITVPHHAYAVWDLEGTKFTYGEFTCNKIEYNIQQ